eukprot:CAMPEP_0181207926 /NCGR_PEP_ID=MMETSP1096-20121128/21849_1 /TAXON_ID=156174 ORGANISM="Chrysochromulina ericina, Strain CCMP281" /NCGR_SAMPLE_ID=MMETSP1096 /ASSEMBLY_ACC=CAM_ASM_000453 /LENGTH=66 /DNA_ID=CAMNT_0023298965 /DNA_START=468 /DNA_END=668 /DNA_ORIENTATION=-
MVPKEGLTEGLAAHACTSSEDSEPSQWRGTAGRSSLVAAAAAATAPGEFGQGASEASRLYRIMPKE